MDDAGEVGRSVERKGCIEMHTMYEPYVRQAYVFEIGLENDVRWRPTGIIKDSGIKILRVFVSAM